jgi:hypothetical protein
VGTKIAETLLFVLIVAVCTAPIWCGILSALCWRYKSSRALKAADASPQAGPNGKMCDEDPTKHCCGRCHHEAE